jgi:hypothetical protein
VVIVELGAVVILVALISLKSLVASLLLPVLELALDIVVVWP